MYENVVLCPLWGEGVGGGKKRKRERKEGGKEGKGRETVRREEETKAERTEREIEMRHREKWGPPEIGTRRDRKRRRGSFVFKGVKYKPTQVSQSEPPHRGSWGEKTRCHVRNLGFHFHLHHLT